jgi:hypothetical protein
MLSGGKAGASWNGLDMKRYLQGQAASEVGPEVSSSGGKISVDFDLWQLVN